MKNEEGFEMNMGTSNQPNTGDSTPPPVAQNPLPPQDAPASPSTPPQPGQMPAEPAQSAPSPAPQFTPPPFGTPPAAEDNQGSFDAPVGSVPSQPAPTSWSTPQVMQPPAQYQQQFPQHYPQAEVGAQPHQQFASPPQVSPQAGVAAPGAMGAPVSPTGAVFPAAAQFRPVPGTTPFFNQPALDVSYQPGTPPNFFLALSIVSVLVSYLVAWYPVGAVALYFSIDSKIKWGYGDEIGSYNSARYAKLVSLILLAVSVLFWVFKLII